MCTPAFKTPENLPNLSTTKTVDCSTTLIDENAIIAKKTITIIKNHPRLKPPKNIKYYFTTTFTPSILSISTVESTGIFSPDSDLADQISPSTLI